MAKKKISNIYNAPITFNNINKMWNIVRKSCKNKRGIYEFSLNKNTNIYNIGKILKEKSYKPYPYRLFMIFEPKPRLVMSQCVYDKIINHFVANYYLLPYLEKKLLNCNVATRKNMGSDYAIKLTKKYINEIRIKNPNKEIYVLKMDISKYFYTINHEILLNMLKRDINDFDVIKLIESIISETDKSYINDMVDKLNKHNKTDIPHYENGVGLSIGAMTSQFLAIYYLNDLDHYIKEQLKCKYFIRYMDDILIFDVNFDKLKKLWKLIENKVNDLKLNVNPKSNIFRLSNGVIFVGYRFKIDNCGFKMKFNKKTIKRINHKLKYLQENNIVKYYRSYASYYGYYKRVRKYSERNFKMKSIEKYKAYKEKYMNCIVFIREGKFYCTFVDDAIFIWNLFDYKWNKNSISFGESACSKVFDYLKNKSIGYVIVSNDDIFVKGDNKIYDLYLEAAKINYDRYCKKKEISSLIDSILVENINYCDDIIDYLNKYKSK